MSMVKAANPRSKPSLYEALDALRAEPALDMQTLAARLELQGIVIAPADLSVLRSFVAMTWGPRGSMLMPPEWLISVFLDLLKDTDSHTLCDPWAGAGWLVRALVDAEIASEFHAITPHQGELALGRVIAPSVQWHSTDVLQWLSTQTSQIDCFVSCPPFGIKSSAFIGLGSASAEQIEARGDLAQLIAIKAGQCLPPDGRGLFVVSTSFFVRDSLFRRMSEFGLGVEAAFALPAGTFAPHANIPAYLIVVGRNPDSRLFVAPLSSDTTVNKRVIGNFRHAADGDPLGAGGFVDAASFTGLEAIRSAAALEFAAAQMHHPAETLGGSLAKEIVQGRYQQDFQDAPNTIYVPLLGNSDVRESLDELTLKSQNYAQVVINPDRSSATFVARFLNSELGRELRAKSRAGGSIPRLTKASLASLPVFIPDQATQRHILAVEASIAAERNTLLALENELQTLRNTLWSSFPSTAEVEGGVKELSAKLAGSHGYMEDGLTRWMDSLPFPLASILRKWLTTPERDQKTKYEHLIHFFEATAEFFATILLSAYSSNPALFEPHRRKLLEALNNQNLCFGRATFGTWKVVLEYLGKATRNLLNGNTRDGEENRRLCGEIFSDSTAELAVLASHKDLPGIVSKANKLRNDSSHGGVQSTEAWKQRHEILHEELQRLRGVFQDAWTHYRLVRSTGSRFRKGVFETDLLELRGSNSEFLSSETEMRIALDVEHLYITRHDACHALKLLPLIKIEPKDGVHASFFYNRIERDERVRFVSYHHENCSEITETCVEVVELIEGLGAK